MNSVQQDSILLMTCALGFTKDKHICKNPISLNCGHLVCKQCMKQDIIFNVSTKCGICNEENIHTLKDLNEILNEPKWFEIAFNKLLDELFDHIHANFSSTFQLYKDTLSNPTEKVYTMIEYIKDEIEIRIESLKTELDELHSSLNNQLDLIKSEIDGFDFDIIEECVFNKKYFEEELQKLQENREKKVYLTPANFYTFQDTLKKMQNILDSYKKLGPKIELNESESKIHQDIIGHLTYEFPYKKDIDKCIQYRATTIGSTLLDLVEHSSPIEFCVLPNNQLLMANYDDSSLSLCDSKMKYIKTIKEINNNPISIVGLATDGKENLYLSDIKNNMIIKTDFEFNQKATFKNAQMVPKNNIQLDCPCGICFYKGFLFVCDRNNKRIVKLDSNLVFSNVFKLSNSPWFIKNIENTACIRSNDKTIEFYNLDSFSLIRKYDGCEGFIGVSSKYFYEYDHRKKTLFIYTKNGSYEENIILNHNDDDYANVDDSMSDWNSLCVFNSKLIISNCFKKNVILI